MENHHSIRSGRAVIVTNNGSGLHGGHSGSYDSFFYSIPPGYHFKPLDEELVAYYLRRKIANLPLPPNIINEVELYKFSPNVLTAKYKRDGEDGQMWYFFTPRDKKYPKGTRPDRAAGNGYWKATGVKKDVMSKNVKIGFKTSLVFYEGKSPKGKKSDWLMHEFNVKAPPKKADRNNMRLDDWVLCRVYMKPNKAKKLKASNQSSDDVNQAQEQPNDEGTAQDNGHDYDGVDLSPQNPDEYPLPQNSINQYHPLINPNHQSYLVFNQNGYYSSEGYGLFSNSNAMGYDGFSEAEPSTILPPQNDQHFYLPYHNSQQYNGYQPHQQLWG